jgi:DNA-directed RNA polymerase subunit M/transcription elongation factor TFIIS
MSHVRCPNCTRRLRAPDDGGQHRFRCPACQHVFEAAAGQYVSDRAPGQCVQTAQAAQTGPADPGEQTPPRAAARWAPDRTPIGPVRQDADGAKIDVGGFAFPFAADLPELLTTVAQRRACCTIIETRLFPIEQAKVLEFLEKTYGPGSDWTLAVQHTRLICYGCGQEYDSGKLLFLRFPDRYPAEANFVATGACPGCGGRKSLYVFDNLLAGEVTAGDLEMLRTYWRHQAAMWWQAQPRSADFCYTCQAPLPKGTGYRRGDRLYCRNCVVHETDLTHLRANPHYFGSGELTKARGFLTHAAGG